VIVFPLVVSQWHGAIESRLVLSGNDYNPFASVSEVSSEDSYVVTKANACPTKKDFANEHRIDHPADRK